MESKAARIANAPVVDLSGTWQRHVSVRHAETALEGRVGYGRWGTKGGFPVLYLGKPVDSVVVEAYRHLVDPLLDVDMPLTALAPRVLITVSVSVTNIVDLTTPFGRSQAGLVPADLTSRTDDRDAYRRCQEVAQVAHQLGRHGILAPAATGMGDTLALFADILPVSEQPERSEDDVLWSTLPPDPRRDGSSHLFLIRGS